MLHKLWCTIFQVKLHHNYDESFANSASCSQGLFFVSSYILYERLFFVSLYILYESLFFVSSSMLCDYEKKPRITDKIFYKIPNLDGKWLEERDGTSAAS